MPVPEIHVHVSLMMDEVFEAQLKTAALYLQYPAELLLIPALAVRGEAHDLVFVAETRKSEVLRQGRVIEPQGVGERDLSGRAYASSLTRRRR